MSDVVKRSYVTVLVLIAASILFTGASIMKEEEKQRILLDFEQPGDAAN